MWSIARTCARNKKCHYLPSRGFKAGMGSGDFKRRTDIYCHGTLLKTVQNARIFKDSTTFVDMKMKVPPAHLLFNFKKFMRENNFEPTKARIKRFVLKHFDIVDSEYDPWIPPDFIEEPKFIQTIKDEDFRNWAYEIVQIWPLLGKKMKRDVKIDEEKYSIIYVENGIIVPGGRFRSFYYWDSYWIILGLLISEMFTTVRGMLDNLIYIINTYGHIPNGGRIYYMHRSQPPLFIPMMKLYYDYTKDLQYVKDNVEAAEMEMDYWMSNHLIDVDKGGLNYSLAVYGDSSIGPRPESYYEDVNNAEIFLNEQEKEDFYSEIKATAESGWDFSSRWIIKNATDKGELIDTKTRSIIPVDLNSILYWNLTILAEFFTLLGDERKAKMYKKEAEMWMKAVMAVMWHEDRGCWLDYDVFNLCRRDYFYPSNVTPLWTGCFPPENKEYYVQKVVNYLKSTKAIGIGGVPTSFNDTGQQWDYPNAWSPLQHIMVEGLSNSEQREAQRLAFRIAQRWIRNNFHAFEEYGVMFEKYNAVHGGAGGGGEYGIQLGFGWTNGVCLHFLQKYCNILTVDDFPKPIITDNSYLTFGHVDAYDY